MRKIYSLVVLLVALLTSSVVASAANVTFKTPDPSKVTIGWRQYYSGTPDPLEWNSGDFTYDLSDGFIVIKLSQDMSLSPLPPLRTEFM